MAEPPHSSSDPAAAPLGDTTPASDPALDATHAAGGSPPASHPDRLRPGELLGKRYRLRRLLGHGGMGAVYLATDESLGKDVALKFVKRELGDGGFAQLRDEVLLAQRVTHPNVCRTYDLEDLDGHPVVKMEYVPGETLAQRLTRGRFTVDEVLAVVRPLASGLAAAHAQGVVHRDIKPQNVLLEDGGRVVLMDFGIARPVLPGAEDSHSISGTPEYMAPEQVLGRATDGRADLYALGCVLYRMLVGEAVFPAESHSARALRHVEDPPPDPVRLRPDLPAWLGRLILRLLEKQPERRYPSADALLLALAGPRRRSRWILVAAAAAAGLLAWPIYLLARAGSWHPRIEEVLPSYEEAAGAAAWSPDGTRIAYPSNRDGDMRLYVDQLGTTVSRAVTPPGRTAYAVRWTRDGKALLYVEGLRAWRQRLDGNAPEPLTTSMASVEDCGGRLLLAYAEAPGCQSCPRLVVRPEGSGVGGERELLRLAADQDIESVRCDRAGQRAVYAAGRRRYGGAPKETDLFVVSLDGGGARQLTSDHQGNLWPTFAPDGRSVIFSSNRGGTTHLWELALDGNGAPRPITSGEGPDVSAEVSPDGKQLLFNNSVSSSPLFAITPGSGRPARRLTHTLEELGILQPTPDGKEVIAVSRRRGRTHIVACSLADGDERILVDGDTPALSLDGKEVYYSVPRGDGTHILALPRQGGASRPVTELSGQVFGMDPGPDGFLYFALLLAADRQTWKAPLAGGPATLVSARFADVAPMPTGGWTLATQGTQGNLAETHLIPPGGSIDDPGAAVVALALAFGAADGRSLLYWDLRSVRRRVFATGEDQLLFPLSGPSSLGESPDGKTIYYTASVGHVRRMLITDFDRRPRW